MINTYSDDEIHSLEVQKRQFPHRDWAFVLSAFGTSACTLGVYFSMGVLYTELHNRFLMPNVELCLVYSTVWTLLLAMVPAAQSLSSHFGHKYTAFGGSIVASISSLVTPFAFSWLLIPCVFLTGVGNGICLISSLLNLEKYVPARYSRFAVTLGLTGAMTGSCVLPVLLRLLVTEYGLKSALWILAAFGLNACAFALLLPSARCAESRGTRLRAIHNNCVQTPVDVITREDEIPGIHERLNGSWGVHTCYSNMDRIASSVEIVSYLICYSVMSLALPSHLSDLQFTDTATAAMCGIYGAFHFFGYIFTMPFRTTDDCNARGVPIMFASLVMSLACLLIPSAEWYVLLLACVATHAFCNGIHLYYLPGYVTTNFSFLSPAKILLLLMLLAMPTVAFACVGRFRDTSGGWAAAFYLIGVINAGSVIARGATLLFRLSKQSGFSLSRCLLDKWKVVRQNKGHN